MWRQASLRRRVVLVAFVTALISGAGVVAMPTLRAGVAPDMPAAQATPTEARPNILWLVSEDNGPEIGAYGDRYATTPSIDRLAAKGFRYRVAWSNGPVCGAARTALIAGVYPESTGGEHMRSLADLPMFMRLYPTLLRDAGYYTTNNSKTDYNYADDGTVWDASSAGAHWRNRKAGQPFFSIFNFMQSHESQIRTRPHTWVHDPAQAPVPAYMPDVREVREDWAQYYDQLSVIDRGVGERLAELDAAGLADDTIVVYYGDHGAGMPRSKRFPYNSGLQVPLVVYIPPKFRHLGPAEAARPGSESTRLVSFVDFAPTLVSLAGVQPPSWMQGRAFLGRFTAPAPTYVFGFRGRMDERYDLMRSVRDDRYVYLRNYMPHRPYGQYVGYMFETPTTAVWKQMFDRGQLTAPQRAFWEPKPSEELYDLQQDRWEVENLAASPAHADIRNRLRQALDDHAREVRDVGFLPEYALHREGVTAYEIGHDPARYDFARIYAAAQQASDRSVPLSAIRPLLTNRDPIVRFWGAMGVVIRGAEAVRAEATTLESLFADAEPGPRIVAAEGLGRFGEPSARRRAIARLLEDGNPERHGEYVALFALYSLNQIPDLSPEVVAAVQQLPNLGPDPGRTLRAREDYLPRAKSAIAQNRR